MAKSLVWGIGQAQCLEIERSEILLQLTCHKRFREKKMKPTVGQNVTDRINPILAQIEEKITI